MGAVWPWRAGYLEGSIIPTSDTWWKKPPGDHNSPNALRLWDPETKLAELFTAYKRGLRYVLTPYKSWDFFTSEFFRRFLSYWQVIPYYHWKLMELISLGQIWMVSPCFPPIQWFVWGFGWVWYGWVLEQLYMFVRNKQISPPTFLGKWWS